MTKAIDKAWQYQLLTYPNPAVGALIRQDDKILSIKAHQRCGQNHAELDVIKDVYIQQYPNSILKTILDPVKITNYLLENHNNIFNNLSIYVTLEPCVHIGRTPSCAMLLQTLKFKDIFIGTKDTNQKATGGYEMLKNNKADISIGVCEKQAKELLLPFVLWHKKSFSFFKLAMREDGSIDDGYITSKNSLKIVHRYRSLTDLVVLGGKTVRVDRPTVDTRFLKNKTNNPDILIYSREKEFDKTIKLFTVKNRTVHISNSLALVDKQNFVMFEGGFNMLKQVQKKIDMIVLFVSKKSCKSQNYLKFLQNYTILKKVVGEVDDIYFLI